MAKKVLYTNPLSSNCRPARVVAAELGHALDLVELDFAKGDMKQAEYLARNPNGKVPTLVDGDFVLWESPAIMIYLASQDRERRLLPEDARGQADTLRWMFWNASHLEPAVFAFASETYFKPMRKETPDAAKIEAALKDFARYAAVLEHQLEGKEYITGRLSLADLAIGVSLEFGVTAGLDLAKHRTLGAWLARLRARPSWKA